MTEITIVEAVGRIFQSFAGTIELIVGGMFGIYLIMVFLNRIGMVTVQGFGKARRMAILVGFVLSAFLTPPDPFSLLLMAVPLVLLYEVGILVCRLLSLGKKKEALE